MDRETAGRPGTSSHTSVADALHEALGDRTGALSPDLTGRDATRPALT